MVNTLYYFLLAAISTTICEVAINHILHKNNVFDHPNQRSSHTSLTVRGGGIGILIIILLFNIWFFKKGYLPIAITCLIGLTIFLGVISFIDDTKSLSAVLRFNCHGIAALSALGIIGWPNFLNSASINISECVTATISILFLLLCIIGYTNAFNFMDGINGIAGFQAVIGMGGFALIVGISTGNWQTPIVLLAFVVAGSSAGFLPHNFPRARMFMGDVGSISIGFLSAVLVVWAGNEFGWWLTIPMAMLHANFFLDTGITLIRRILRGERWYQPHREHFYQKLIRAGKSHAYVTICEMGLQLVVLGLMIYYPLASTIQRFALVGTVLVIWTVFFTYCEVTFRKIVVIKL